ncbi:hypothetical protein Ancab_031006 [Ancistrocladus abbreviatus]
MLNDQRATASTTPTPTPAATTTTDNNNTHHDDQQAQEESGFRDIHALTTPRLPPINTRRGSWETSSHRSSSLSMASEAPSSENFTTLSREFNALVLAGSGINNSYSNNNNSSNENDVGSNNRNNGNLSRIREEDGLPEDEVNPLAIVPDNNPPLPSPRHSGSTNDMACGNQGEISVLRVKREEVETKISAWQNAKVAKINNRFKREDAIISGWENEQVQKATSGMKKIERKLEEKRARAMEKMENDIAKARRKAEERRATAEAKKGTKVARVLEVSSLMRAVGRPPAKRSFF